VALIVDITLRVRLHHAERDVYDQGQLARRSMDFINQLKPPLPKIIALA
jgi:hypothetical protein